MFKPYKGFEPYIFISYNHRDKDIVFRIITDLHNRGYRVWYDNAIPSGDYFSQTLANRILDCAVMFCFLSPRYVISKYCRRELTYALSKDKRIIPIKIEDFDLPSEIEFSLSGVSWEKLSRFPSETALIDHICDVNSDNLEPCLDPSMTDIIPPPGPPPGLPPWSPKPWWKKYGWLIAVIAAGLILAGWFFLGRRYEPALKAPQSGVQETAGEPAPSGSEEKQTERTFTSEMKDPAELAASGQKASEYLAARAAGGCPVSVYDPKGTAEEEEQFVYDNAMAALALLSESSRYKNHISDEAGQILESIAELEKNSLAEWYQTDTKSLAAAAIALLQYDKVRSTASYVRAAQNLLDHVLKNCSSKDGGYSDRPGSSVRSSEGNLWLYAAFHMLSVKTGNADYASAADSALSFVQSQRSADGLYYQAGELKEDGKTPDYVSVPLQALSVLVMNDQTGMKSALALQTDEGGFAPDGASTGGFSTECTALMALACQMQGMETESAQALSAVYPYQLGNGGIPAGSGAQVTDGEGKNLPNVAKTSAAAWYAMAVSGFNPFQYDR